ncbi:conserved hypothetical protein [Theileria equi strain WA]|uniref:Prefoldin subunit n=1 Tax=Theileria equi strain WA TaxID=1537102 RepID=L1LCQ5_THEEQ|nr:conserved hypothetical protein [Theileria equi strain WA]EKX73064.1 conserved hypothetical protein [Theileria equi strain WA]|eukprot:XP_004832516.1 conserved hypothetical protein [Theileria equi strain WA]
MESGDVDHSLRHFQLLQETQSQIEILNNQIAKINKHISTQKIKSKRAETGIEVLNYTREDQKVYKQVSRLLILRDKVELKNEFEREKEDSLADLPKLEGVKNQLVAKLGGLNAQFVELSRQIREAQSV